MRAIATGELPPPPVAQLLGFGRIDPVEEGRVVFTMDPVPRSTSTRSGPSTAACMSTLLDSAMGCAVHTTLPPARCTRRSELKVTSCARRSAGGAAPARRGHRVCNRGSTAVLVEATVTDAEQGKKIASRVRRPA